MTHAKTYRPAALVQSREADLWLAGEECHETQSQDLMEFFSFGERFLLWRKFQLQVINHVVSDGDGVSSTQKSKVKPNTEAFIISLIAFNNAELSTTS